MRNILLYLILPFVFVLFMMGHASAQKTDTIIHINGNVMTGELKKLVYGVATWKMDGMGTISMDEVKINTISSEKMFEVKMKNGFIYFGSFDTSHVERQVYILLTNGKRLVAIDEIVEIYPIRRNFWMRTSGKFSLGANFSKASNVGNITFSGYLNYRKRRTYFELNWDDNNTYQGDTLSSSKSDVNLQWQRLLTNNWSTGVNAGLSQNTELGTKLRIDLTGMGIKDIFYNNWNRLYTGAGLSIARETPYDGSSIQNDLAGVVTIVWKVYKYTVPKVWVDANLDFLPYFTGESRYRTNFNLNPQVSIFSDDFKVGFSFYYKYDSNPQSSTAAKDDYGINLELSYTFH